jgi:hypothetical protein
MRKLSSIKVSNPEIIWLALIAFEIDVGSNRKWT